MEPDYTSIKKHLLNTLAFLANVDKQKRFAREVSYESYQDEFACWWLDEYFPDEAVVSGMFSAEHAEALNAFTTCLDERTDELGSQPLTIEQLHATPQWQQVVASATVTCEVLNGAA